MRHRTLYTSAAIVGVVAMLGAMSVASKPVPLDPRLANQQAVSNARVETTATQEKPTGIIDDCPPAVE